MNMSPRSGIRKRRRSDSDDESAQQPTKKLPLRHPTRSKSFGTNHQVVSLHPERPISQNCFAVGFGKMLSKYDSIACYAVSHLFVKVLRVYRCLRVESLIALHRTASIPFLSNDEPSEVAAAPGDVEMAPAFPEFRIEDLSTEKIAPGLVRSLDASSRLSSILSSDSFLHLDQVVSSLHGFVLLLSRNSTQDARFRLAYASRSIAEYGPLPSSLSNLDVLFSWLFPSSPDHLLHLSRHYAEIVLPRLHSFSDRPAIFCEQAIDVCFGSAWFFITSMFLREGEHGSCEFSIHSFVPLREWKISPLHRSLESSSSHNSLVPVSSSVSYPYLCPLQISPIVSCACASSVAKSVPCCRLEQTFFDEEAFMSVFSSPYIEVL